jgi:MFS family permease
MNLASNRSFLSLWISHASGNLGNVLYIVALIPFIYNATGSVSSTALVPFFSSMAQLISGILAPAIIDRFPLRRIVIYFQALKTVALLGLSLFLDALSGNMVGILAFVVFISFLTGWTAPALGALLPQVVERERLVKANGCISTTSQMVFLAGYSLGGVWVATFGSPSALSSTVGLYLLSTASILWVHTHSNMEDRTELLKISWLTRMKEGWAVLWNNRVLRSTMGMDVVETIANGVWTAAIMLVFVETFLERDEAWWGFLNASYYIGTMLGGFMALWISIWLQSNLGKGMIFGAAFMALFTALFAVIPVPWIALLLCVLMGPAYQIRDIAQATLFQLEVEDRKLAKVNAARGTLTYALFGLAILLMALLSEWFNISIVYLAAAAVYGLSALFAIHVNRLLTKRKEMAR